MLNPESSSMIKEMIISNGVSLRNFSDEGPVMLIFLRHFGCTFCREALSDISRDRSQIESTGTKLVFVHMSTPEIAEEYFKKYNLDGALHISDPECKYYASFGLVKGNLTQLFGLKTWIRGFSAGVMDGHGVGPQLGDGFQMPGVFIISEGEIRESFVHKQASDRPDYHELAKCCIVSE